MSPLAGDGGILTLRPPLDSRGEGAGACSAVGATVLSAGRPLWDEGMITRHDIGGQMRVLQRLVAQLGDAEWKQRVVFLTR